MSDSRYGSTDDTMDIWAESGTRVRFSYPNAGYPSDVRKAASLLTVENIYTVDGTVVDSEGTRVFLQEVPGVSFNSVQFSTLEQL